MADQRTIIFGIHPVQELLKSKKRKVYQLYSTDPAPKLVQAIKKQLPVHVECKVVSKEQLAKLTGSTDHQGIAAVVQPLPVQSRCFVPQHHPFVLLLDGIQDPRNMGAIIRSAACMGVTGIVIPQKGSCPLNGVVCKASAGMIEYVSLYQPAHSVQAAQELRAAGYTIYLATAAGADVRSVSMATPLCLVIGSEGSGIRPALQGQGAAISIPQRFPDSSYNASVAAGILLFVMAEKVRFL